MIPSWELIFLEAERYRLYVQNYALFPNMTVKENIEIAIRRKKDKKLVVEEMLNLFCINELQNRYPKQLSGGEQQRVALARMMAYEPVLLMFDEPFSALDSYLKDQLQRELLETLHNYTGDVLMVSHSRDELYRFCDIIAVLEKGCISRTGDKRDVFEEPRNLTCARLTGCKNISRARRISDDEVFAVDWNIALKTNKTVEEDIQYVGIRAHHLIPVKDELTENKLRVSIVDFEEGPFENRIILYNSNYSKEGEKLWWIVSKQNWKNIYQEQLPQYISFPKEHLLLLKN